MKIGKDIRPVEQHIEHLCFGDGVNPAVIQVGIPGVFLNLLFRLFQVKTAQIYQRAPHGQIDRQLAVYHQRHIRPFAGQCRVNQDLIGIHQTELDANSRLCGNSARIIFSSICA